MQVRIAAVAAQCTRGEAEVENVRRALDYIDEAAAKGANIVSFPEGFPGPYNGPVTYSALEVLCAKARERSVYVIASMVERASTSLSREVYYLALKLIDPAGNVVGTYHRVLPNPREMNTVLMGGKIIAPGDRLQTFETSYGRLGLLICSEIWSPELPLILALQGADVIFAPIGGALYELCENWKIILRARAAENLVYVIASQNHWGMEAGLNMVVGPEGIVAESTSQGVLMATVDLKRLEWLRSNVQKMEIPKPYRTIPGMLRHRRPELYGAIIEPREDLYDFHYFTRDLKPQGAR